MKGMRSRRSWARSHRNEPAAAAMTNQRQEYCAAASSHSGTKRSAGSLLRGWRELAGASLMRRLGLAGSVRNLSPHTRFSFLNGHLIPPLMSLNLSYFSVLG
jgi:hypothetical protein